MDFLNYNKLKQFYDEQKKIETYQTKRTLDVPSTNIFTFICLSIIMLLLIVIPVSLVVTILDRTFNKVIFIIIVLHITFETYGRFLGIKAVECYQHYAKEERRRRCLCVPSCSEYAILCFKNMVLSKHCVRFVNDYL